MALCRLRTSCAQPRIWGRLHGSLPAAYVKTSRCVTLRPEFGSGNEERLRGRHISCAPSYFGESTGWLDAFGGLYSYLHYPEVFYFMCYEIEREEEL